MLIFWHAEDYIPEMIRYEMPRKAKKRLPVLDAAQLQKLPQACNVRDKAIILFLVDSGQRMTFAKVAPGLTRYSYRLGTYP